MQEDQEGQGFSKKARTYILNAKKRMNQHFLILLMDLFLTQKVVTQKIPVSPGLMPRVIKNQKILMMIL